MTDIAKVRKKVRKILVLAANPKDTVRLRLDSEVQNLREGLQRLNQPEQFVIEQRWSVKPIDIQQALLEVEPQIVHFLGYGTSNEGLVFEDRAGNAQFVSGNALANLFALFAEQVECVVLNGCYSAEQADAISQHIPFVVGVRQAIADEAAIEFTTVFYSAIGNERTVEFAHKLGCNAIELAGFQGSPHPVLLTQADEDEVSADSLPASVEAAPLSKSVAPDIGQALGQALDQDLENGISVFFSYAHEDEDLRDELAKHLRNMERRGIISSWYDRDISAGSEWAQQIDDNLDKAQIVLLLISSDFMDSDYCNAVELQRAMERHRAGSALVIPVILRPTDWVGAEFEGLQALPQDARPITKWDDRDEAFLDVSKGIRRIAERLQKKNTAAAARKPTSSERLDSLDNATKIPFVLSQVDIGTFTGRKQELEQLKSCLVGAEGSSICSIVGLSGGGGIGKSALAAHFATQYQDAFPNGVIGLRVEDKDVNTIARDFILELYKYTGQTLDPEEEREAAVLMQESFGHLRMLLIFDNADNASALQPLISAVGRSSIIITTRDRGLPVSLNVPESGIVDVPTLPTADSLRLFRRIVGEERVNEEIEAAYKIIQLVENLPLALQITGAYLKLQRQRSLGDYATHLNEEQKRLGRLNLHVFFEISIRSLQPKTVDFFACLSACSKDGFSRRAAMAAAGLENEFEAQDLIDPLYKLSLINYAEAGENRFVLHTLIHLFAQKIAKDKEIFEEARARHANFFIDLIEEINIDDEFNVQQLSEDFDDIILSVNWLQTQPEPEYEFAMKLRPVFQQFGYWEKAVEIMNSFQHLAEIREDWHGVVQFRIQQAKYLTLLEQLDKAENTLAPVESVLQKIVDRSSRLYCEASWLNTLKGILMSKNLINESIKVLNRVIEINEARGDAQSICISLNALSGALQQQRRWDEAVDALQRAVKVASDLENPQSLRISLSALGGVLQQQQRYHEAIDVLQRAVEVAEGIENVQSLRISLSALGGVLLQQQRYDEAIVVLQRAVKVAKTLKDSQQLCISLNALGGALQQQRRWDEASDVLQHAVEVASDLENPQSLRISLSALGGVLQQQQRWDEASDVLQHAVEVAETLEDAQSLIISLNAFSEVLQRQRRWDEAVVVLQRAVEVAETLENSQRLSFSLSYLGRVLQQQRRWDEAVVVLQRAVEVAETLEEDPQNLSISLNAFAGVLQQQQHWNKAVAVLQRAVEVDQASEDLRNLSISLNALGGVLQQQQRWNEAVNALQRAVEVADAINNSQQLFISLNALSGLLQQRQRWDEAITIRERAVEIAETLEDSQSLAISLNVLGGVLQQRQRWDEVIVVRERAVELAEKQQDAQSLASSLNLLGRAFQLKHQPQNAVPVLLKGLEVSEDLKDPNRIGAILNTLGGVYKDLKQWGDAERCLRRCFDLAEKEKNTMGKAIALNGLGQVLEKQGSKKFGIALAAFRESIKLGEAEGNLSHLAKVHTSMGQALLRNRQVEDAIEHLEQSFEIDVANRNQRGVSLVMLYLAPALTQKGKKTKAIQYVQRALEIAPSHQGLLNLYQQLTGVQVERNIDRNSIKQGTIKFVRQNQKGVRYGYVAPADGSRDIYFREGFIEASILDILDAGRLVEVEVIQQAKGPCAKSIRLLPDIGEDA